ncbi:MAG: hypothetical protein AAGA89_17030 [Pseudomonadota bacterium]
MIPILGFFAGAAYGAHRAWRNKGKRLDIAQYAGVYGILFAILALFANIFLIRSVF